MKLFNIEDLGMGERLGERVFVFGFDNEASCWARKPQFGWLAEVVPWEISRWYNANDENPTETAIPFSVFRGLSTSSIPQTALVHIAEKSDNPEEFYEKLASRFNDRYFLDYRPRILLEDDGEMVWGHHCSWLFKADLDSVDPAWYSRFISRVETGGTNE